MLYTVRNVAMIIALTGSLSIGLKPCGLLVDWMEGHQQEVLELQSFAVEGFAQVLQSLNTLYAQNPQAFSQFVSLCIQSSNSSIPDDLLTQLKTFGLIDESAQIPDLVRLVLDWAVEQNADGSIKIWSLDDLVKDGWIRLMLGKKKA